MASVSDKVMAFRRARASDLEQFIRVVGKMVNCNPAAIYAAVEQLKDAKYVPKIDPSEPINYNYWGYQISDLTFYFLESPRHIHPRKATNLSLTLGIKLIADINDFEKIKDPYKYLEFNIVVAGTYQNDAGQAVELISSYHLDRHLPNASGNESEDVHPMYHFQFGGRKLEKEYRDFGNSLILDSPRIVHYPMDIILGVDFVLSNFFCPSWHSLRREGEYFNIVSDYQDYFWRPYAHSKASHWKDFNLANVGWNPVNIWPQLLNKRNA